MPWNLIRVNEKIKNKIYDYFVMKETIQMETLVKPL